jgi:hypothetical protein
MVLAGVRLCLERFSTLAAALLRATKEAYADRFLGTLVRLIFP